MDQPVIDAQFNGPDRSGNGGYVCGMIAEQLPAPGVHTSMLRVPPPLDTPLAWSSANGTVSLLQPPDILIGTAQAGEFSDEVPPCPTLAQAQAGMAAYPGFRHHPFDHCFTCGTARKPGDGLRIFTGPIGQSTVAAPWTPHEAFGGEDGRIDVPVMWAALDCPGGWAVDFTKIPIVLGKMTAEVFRRPRAGEDCLSTGHLRRRDGRKFLTDTALYSTAGELLGRAEQVWIAIDLKDFR